MKKLLIMFLFTLPLILITAQDLITVTGKVTDETNMGVPGVAVVIKGTTQGGITNLDGEYTITVGKNDVLIFSFIGFATVEVNVENRTNIDVQLTEVAFDMDEVVVVGYGSSSVKDLTAPISVVSSEELVKQTVTTVGQALQGKVAGVQISNDGTPGSSPTIRIRGLGTVSSSADPLYVVDGVFVDNIGFLSPYQIETITVLKDASSSAIYGVRAANGVIIVTTKRGKNQKPNVSYNGYVGLQFVSNILKMANKDQYIDLLNEKLYAGYTRDTVTGSYQPFDPGAYPDNTDWFDEVLRTALIQNHDINITGGNEFSSYNFGIGITNQEGMVKKNEFTRLNVRGTQDININKHLKAGYNVNISAWKTDNAPDVLMQSYLAPPAFKPKVDNDTYTDPVILGFGNFANPAASVEYYNDKTQGVKALTNAYAEIYPVKGLTLRSSFTVDGTYSQGRGYSPYYYVSVTQHDTITHLYKSNNQNLNYTFDNTATYEKVMGNHRFKAMAGLSFVQFRNQYFNASTSRVPYFTESTLYLSNGSTDDLSAGDGGGKLRSASYFGRIFYSYRDRYLFTGTFRRDGSSTFPKEERWANAPAIGVGWVISEEDFMNNISQINFLKLRASLGILGNNNVPQNAYTVTVDNWGGYNVVYGPYGSAIISQGASITSIVEPLLKWETVEEVDAGFEALMFDNHLNLEFDFYRRMTKNAIFPVPVISTSGTSGGSFLDNNAHILNTGVELMVNWKDNLTDKFSYSVGGNLTTNHNEVYKLVPGTLPFYDGGVFNGNLGTYTQEGHPIGEFYVLEVDGVFQNRNEVDNYVDSEGDMIMPDAVPGDLRFKDHNRDGIIDNDDRISYGSYTPKLLYALNFAFEYAQFDLSLDFQGVAGNKIYNAKRVNRFGNENYDADFAENRWHGEGTSDSYPSADIAGGKNVFPSSFFVESGAYFRIRNIQIGYTIPQSLTNRINSSLIRFYLTAQNPFTFFGYNGFSPEIPGGSPSTQGIDYGVYPLSRITSFGVTINF
jgi:TonB-linked SusC/RagA family outer membrane protein